METEIKFVEGTEGIILNRDEGVDPTIHIFDAEVVLSDTDATPNAWPVYHLRVVQDKTDVDLKELSDEELADRRDGIKRGSLPDLTKKEKKLKAELANVDDEWKRRLKDRGSNGSKTLRFTTFLTIDDKYPVLVDREAFELHVLRNKALYLLQSRLSLSDVQTGLAAGRVVPGVEITRKVTVNQRKRKQ